MKHERQIDTLLVSPRRRHRRSPSLSICLTVFRLLPIDEEDIDASLSNDQLKNIQCLQDKGHNHQGGEGRLLSTRWNDEIDEVFSLRTDSKRKTKFSDNYFVEDQPPHRDTSHDNEEDRGDDVAQTEKEFPDRLSRDRGQFRSVRKTSHLRPDRSLVFLLENTRFVSE